MSLLNTYLPVYHFSERHAIRISASPARVMAAVMAYRPEHDRFFRLAIGLREWPSRLERCLRPQSPQLEQPAFGFDNFTLLERRGDEEIVYGLAGQFWRLDYGQVRLQDAAAFVAFQSPGAARLALNYRVHELADGQTELSTETRVQCMDREALCRFRPYWYLIRPVSGLIRKRMLKNVRHVAMSMT